MYHPKVYVYSTIIILFLKLTQDTPLATIGVAVGVMFQYLLKANLAATIGLEINFSN